ncbi:alpha/beta hydrolase [Flexithrix dorotheae]|uniref:alpha/beta hydrolase n=1 Tax=Flexithrix dorotheae TaxID=70993 RepID=UPI0003A9C988|nr:alpha/beta hydrolase [Flexithrix dorotheae]
MANVKYGTHERNVFDIWFADTTKVTPIALYIHGGGFVGGRKESLNVGLLENLLESGISVAAINYRFLKQAPLPAAHHDVLRALQFIRTNAEEWKIDKTKVAAFGGSAGAQLSMWLAFSDEMASPNAKDPVERESSRLVCVATNGGQTTMDSTLWKKWIPEFDRYRTTSEQFYGKLTEKVRIKTIESISAISIISSDDPPIFMEYSMPPDESPSGKGNGWKIHHVIFGIKLKEKMDELGVEADLKYPNAETKYETRLAFLKAKLLD